MVGLEAAAQHQVAVGRVEAVQVGMRKQPQERIAKPSGGELVRVILELVEQHRGEIDHRAHLGVILQVRSHVAVILDRMQVHPGLGIFAGGVIAVIRLVHVPQQDQIQLCIAAHGVRSFSAGAALPGPASPA